MSKITNGDIHMIEVSKLVKGIPRASEVWLRAMCETMPHFGIIGLKRESAFLGQMRHECQEFTRFVENLNYSDPIRIAKIFRRSFDLDQDRVVDPDELELAKKYVRNPQALANRAYANRFGNGDEESGDGWRYRGRCPIQITFKDNYVLAKEWTGIDVVASPDELLVPHVGCAAACGYWKAHGCNELADKEEQLKITREINPGLDGFNDRMALIANTRSILEHG